MTSPFYSLYIIFFIIIIINIIVVIQIFVHLKTSEVHISFAR